MQQQTISGRTTRTTTPTPDNPHGYVDVLKKELEVYEKNLDSFMKDHAGEFVLIKGDHIEGFYADIKEGRKIATKKYALTGSYLLRKITREQEVLHVPAITHGLVNAII